MGFPQFLLWFQYMAVFIFCSNVAALTHFDAAVGLFATASTTESHSPLFGFASSFLTSLQICFSTLLGLSVMDMVCSVKRKKKKGVVASNQEDILRPAEPQAISCVLAVRQYGQRPKADEIRPIQTNCFSSCGGFKNLLFCELSKQRKAENPHVLEAATR